ncbi:MAG: hypothetical protein AAFO69_09815 [Bacteroidota bacterium]
MKRLINLWMIVCITFLVLVACTTDDVNREAEELLHQLQDTAVPSDLGGLHEGHLVLPKGTMSSLSADGSTLIYTLPEEVHYIANENGELAMATMGSFTCTSKCSGGCDVVKFGEQLGCSACPEGSTDDCVGSRGLAGFSVGDGDGGGFINLQKGISFLTAADMDMQQAEPIWTGPSWNVLMSHPEIARSFNSFYEELWNGAEPDLEQAQLVLVSVFGTTVRLYVPSSLMTDGRLGIIAGEAVTCECSSGTTGCKHEDIKKGIIKVGDKCVAGNCTSCRMNF